MYSYCGAIHNQNQNNVSLIRFLVNRRDRSNSPSVDSKLPRRSVVRNQKTAERSTGAWYAVRPCRVAKTTDLQAYNASPMLAITALLTCRSAIFTARKHSPSSCIGCSTNSYLDFSNYSRSFFDKAACLSFGFTFSFSSSSNRSSKLSPPNM